MLCTAERLADTACRTLQSLEAFYFERYLTILYINNRPLPYNLVSPLSLPYTTLCLTAGTMKSGQNIPSYLTLLTVACSM